jgi:hypothetical protein
MQSFSFQTCPNIVFEAKAYAKIATSSSASVRGASCW